MIYFAIGFTGTRNGMTDKQKFIVNELVETLISRGARQVHHGMCIGADSDFHGIATKHNLSIIGHPGINNKGKCITRALVQCDLQFKEFPFLVRDKHIVDSSMVMIATPKGFKEELRSGTWTTIRYAKKINKPYYIVYPNGEIETK